MTIGSSSTTRTVNSSIADIFLPGFRGQTDHEFCVLAFLAVHFDFAPVEADNFSHLEESVASTVAARGEALLENPIQVFRRDPDSVVVDADQEGSRLVEERAFDDPLSFSGLGSSKEGSFVTSSSVTKTR